MTDFLIDVIVDPSKSASGLDRVDSRLQRLEKSGKRLQNTLRRAITLVGIVATVRQLGVFADSLTNVRNRIRLVTRDTAQLNAVTRKLFDIAARTRTGFSATATIFSRTALAVKDLGLSLQETLDFTEALNQAIVLSGVKAQEANAGLIQLSQGLASGTLRGDELRSVLEQLPKVADLIADELGVLRGELRILGEQGKITTADIIKAFTGLAAADLNKAFAESVPTLSQGFSVLTTRIIEYVGEVDTANNVSTTLAETLIVLAANLETIGKAAIVAGAALVGPFAKAGVLFATRAVKALTLAIAANPIGALIILVLAAVTAIIQFGDSIALSADGLVTLKDVALATWQFIVDGVQPAVDAITEGFKIAINFVVRAFDTLNITFADVQKLAKTSVNNIIGFFVGMGNALQSVFNDLGKVFKSVIGDGLVGDLTVSIKSLMGFVTDGLKTITEFAGTILTTLGGIADEINATIDGFDPEDKTFVGTFATIGKNAKDAFVEGFGQDFVGDIVTAVAPGLKQISESAKQISATRRAAPSGGVDGGDQGIGDKGVQKDVLPFALRNQLRLLEQEGKTLRENNRERGIQAELLKLEEKLRSSNVTLNDNTRALLETEVRRLTGLREQADVLDELKEPQEEIADRQRILNELYENGSINLKTFTDQMKGLALAQSDLNISQDEGSFFDGFSLGIDEMLDKVGSFVATAGELFGQFFTDASAGFADAIGSAIAFGDSISEAIGGAARSALASLLSGLIDIGIQFVLDKALGEVFATSQVAGIQAVGATTAAVEATTTATSIAASTATTTAIVADNAAIAAAAAPAAALTSVASFGGAAIAGIAGLIAILALVKGFATGGFVSGPGGPTSDSIPARLSDGEFVVNAKSTERFRPQLEAMNNGGGNEIFSNSSQGESQEGSANNESGGNNVNVINVLDPGIVEDFIDSPAGEQTVLNVIERNASSIAQLIGSS